MLCGRSSSVLAGREQQKAAVWFSRKPMSNGEQVRLSARLPCLFYTPGFISSSGIASLARYHYHRRLHLGACQASCTFILHYSRTIIIFVVSIVSMALPARRRTLAASVWPKQRRRRIQDNTTARRAPAAFGLLLTTTTSTCWVDFYDLGSMVISLSRSLFAVLIEKQRRRRRQSAYLE